MLLTFVILLPCANTTANVLSGRLAGACQMGDYALSCLTGLLSDRCRQLSRSVPPCKQPQRQR